MKKRSAKDAKVAEEDQKVKSENFIITFSEELNVAVKTKLLGKKKETRERIKQKRKKNRNRSRNNRKKCNDVTTGSKILIVWKGFHNIENIQHDSPMLPSSISSVLTVTSSTVLTISLFSRIGGTLVIRCFFACLWIGSDEPRFTLNVTRIGILFSIDALYTRL